MAKDGGPALDIQSMKMDEVRKRLAESFAALDVSLRRASMAVGRAEGYFVNAFNGKLGKDGVIRYPLSMEVAETACQIYGINFDWLKTGRGPQFTKDQGPPPIADADVQILVEVLLGRILQLPPATAFVYTSTLVGVVQILPENIPGADRGTALRSHLAGALAVLEQQWRESKKQ